MMSSHLQYIAALAVLVAIVAAQQSFNNPLSTDLTIALIPNNNAAGNCTSADAPTIHITGFENTTSVCFSAETIFTEQNNDTNYNYTLTNAASYSNTTLYLGLYYQQLSQNTSQDNAKNTLGSLLVETYPCANCVTECDDEGSGVPGQGFVNMGPKVGPGEWLQWDCFAEGGCFDVPYDIKGFTVRTAVDKYDPIEGAEQEDRCELAAVSSGNFTSNNNTMGGHMSGATSRGLSGGMLSIWGTVVLVTGIGAWL